MSSILRGTFAIAALLAMAWVGGQLMLASHVDTHTHNLVGVAIAVAVFVVGGAMFVIRNRRG
jgi:cellobiose-specific phosphotransferase system component IIC